MSNILAATDAHPAKSSSRGRPSMPEEELLDKIRQATIQLLINNGYHATTIDNVAKQAGMAKKTIYRFVNNREALIELVVLGWTDSFVPLFQKNADNSAHFFKSLAFNLTQICHKVLSVEAVGIFRLLQTDFAGKEALLAQYQKQGIERSRGLLADWLTKQAERQIITQQDFISLSDLILSMTIAEPLRQMSLGLVPPLPETDLTHRIDSVVQLCKQLLNPTAN